MQVQSIVQQLLEVVCPSMHRVRRASLVASVLGALRGRRLTVTAIGRALPGGTSQKHGLSGPTGYYRIGTFMDSGSSTIRACVGHSLGRAPARCCWWIGRTWMRANAITCCGRVWR